MYYYLLKDSTHRNKKFMVNKVNQDNVIIGESIHFGAKGYDDYTIHKDEERQYMARHKPSEDWSDLNTAATWSRFLLWNEPNLYDSIKNMEKRFDIKIVLDYA